MTVENMLDELKKKAYSVRYYGPGSHVIPMGFEDDPYSDVRYVIYDDGGEDPDYGCMEVMFDFGNVRFDWYDGTWKTNDPELLTILMDETVQARLSTEFQDLTINLGPSGGNQDDISVWRRVLAKCIDPKDTSGGARLSVMTDCDNATSSNPANFSHERPWDTFRQ